MNNKCLGCAAPLPGAFLDLGVMPLANSYVEPGSAVEEKFPLAVAFCPHCFLVQLTHLVPPAKMFSEYLYFSSFSDSFVEHAHQMCESLVQRYALGAESKVIEIASNDGYLLKAFQKRGIPVLGVEPATNIAAEASRRGVPTLNRFFAPDVVDEIVRTFGSADLIIGNNVLAHVPNINDFLRSVEKCMKPRAGIAVFEFPYLRELLRSGQFDTIYHEHVFYFSLHAIVGLAARAGLEVVDVVAQPVHGGSLRVFLAQAGESAPSHRVSDMLSAESAAGLDTSAPFVGFSAMAQQIRAELRGLLIELKNRGKRIAAYGAPAKGNTLLNYCGVGTDLIEYTVDRSPHKQKKSLPGTHIPIRHPEYVRDDKPDFLLILPWNLESEIITQMDFIREWDGHFIIPVPRVRVS